MGASTGQGWAGGATRAAKNADAELRKHPSLTSQQRIGETYQERDRSLMAASQSARLRELKVAFGSLLIASLVGCGEQGTSKKPAASTAEEDADFVRMASAGRMLSDLQEFLKSKEPVPKSFTFDRLDFRRGSATVRPNDEQTIYSVAHALDVHPNARVRIVGYDDGTGTKGANPALARQRAAAVLMALQKAGVAASRLEAATGREGHGARSTELVVLQK